MRDRRCFEALLLVVCFAACGEQDPGGAEHPPPPPIGEQGPIPESVRPIIPWLDRGAPEIAPPEAPWFAAGTPDVAAPDIPWLSSSDPRISGPAAPCSAGWREELLDANIRACHPYPGPNALTCPPGQAHFPGGAACEELGDPCPADGWPDLPAGTSPVLYVRSDAAPGGDGTIAAPFNRITDAIAIAAAGTTVAIAAGLYDESVRVERAVTLWGACVTATRLTSTLSSTTEGVVTIAARGAEIRNLSFQNANRVSLWIEGATTTASVSAVLIDGGTILGIFARRGANLVASNIAVRNTRPTATGQFGGGLETSNAIVSMRRMVFDGNAGIGVNGNYSGASIDARDIAVRDNGDIGASVGLGGRLQLRRFVIERATFQGLRALEAGTISVAEDGVVRDTVAHRVGHRGHGIVADTGARFEARRLLIERNVELGAGIAREDTEVILEDCIIRDTLTNAAGAAGRGIELSSGARATARRVVLDSNHETGVTAQGASTSLLLEDSIVRNTQRSSVMSAGVVLLGGVTAEVRRSMIDANADTGVDVGGSSTRLTLEDTTIRDTSGSIDVPIGAGLRAGDGAQLTVARALIERSAFAGAQIIDANTTLDVSDTIIRESHPGMAIAAGASAIGRRLLLDANVIFGFTAFDAASAVLEDLHVRASGPNSAGDFGTAVAGGQGAQIELSRAILEDSESCGIYVSSSTAGLIARDVVVRRTRGKVQTYGARCSGLRTERAPVRLERILFEDSSQDAVAAFDAPALIEGTDIVVRNTRSTAEVIDGWGLRLESGASAHLQRTSWVNNQWAAIVARGAETSLLLEDCAVSDTEHNPRYDEQSTDNSPGWGLAGASGARIEVRRASFDRNLSEAIILLDGASADVEDAVVRATMSDSGGFGGGGLVVAGGSRAAVRRMSIDGNRGIAVEVEGANSFADLRDVVVTATRQRGCVADTCAERGAGIGLAARGQGAIKAEGFLIAGNTLAGLVVGPEGAIDLSRGVVSGHPVGVSISNPSFDVSRLEDQVYYLDNERSLDANQNLLEGIQPPTPELPPPPASMHDPPF